MSVCSCETLRGSTGNNFVAFTKYLFCLETFHRYMSASDLQMILKCIKLFQELNIPSEVLIILVLPFNE